MTFTHLFIPTAAPIGAAPSSYNNTHPDDPLRPGSPPPSGCFQKPAGQQNPSSHPGPGFCTTTPSACYAQNGQQYSVYRCGWLCIEDRSLTFVIRRA